MPPKKRKTSGHGVQHLGRVTVHHNDTFPRAADPPPLGQRRHRTDDLEVPGASARYTPPIKHVRFRPGWHRVVGAVTVLLGVGVAVANDAMLLGAPATMLPGGHNELYLLLGVVIAGSSLWWFGWMDREA